MSRFRGINFLALILCFALIVLGAFVRLSDAGLGCPDWPGCYGQATVPAAAHELAAAQTLYPGQAVEAPKAWKEMIHRYLAGAVGLLIAALAVLAALDRRLPRGLAFAVLGVLIVQIVFGALTVTLKVNPLIVTTHLLLGLTTLSLLWWMWLSTGTPERGLVRAPGAIRPLASCALVLLLAQIALGGWTSTNYAALACPDFPTCQGELLPPLDLAGAFTPWHGLKTNYEYGVLGNAARVTIHVVHRFGAAIVGTALTLIGLYLIRSGRSPLWRRLGAAVLAAVVLQIVIGISMVKLSLPLWLADAHNAGAALLLLCVLALNFHAWRGPQGVRS